MAASEPFLLPLTRRELLAAGAGLLVAAACGGDSEGGGAAATTAPEASPGPALVKFFQDTTAGEEVRLPFGVADADGVPLSAGPDELRLVVTSGDGSQVASMTVPRHGEGLPRSYYPVRLTLPDAGVYEATTELETGVISAAFMAVPAQQAAVPGPGDPMVPVTTPTVADPRGVDPVCTREPPCPLHTVSLDAALQAGKPVAFLIATPAFCATRICGPVVDVLTNQLDAYGDRVTLIHNEVYTSMEASQTTEAVQAYQLTFEPVLFLAGADGVVRRRLDIIFDEAELRAALDELAA